jgi:hypothetical protein
MALTKEQQRHLTNLYTIAQKYPGKKTAVIAKLEEFGLTVDDFNAHDSLMVSQNIVEPSSIVDEYPDIPGFTQSDKYSDVKILEIFEARDALESKKAKIGSPPTDAEWFQAGLTAEQRIAELRPFFETKKEEEWENLRSFMATPEGMEGETFLPSGFYEAIGSSITGVLGLGQEMMFGALDATTDFKDVTSHERGFGGSGNIFTGFGAWDLAEFKTNKMTGQRGYSPELLEIEKTLDDLYGQKREYNEQMRDRGYRDVGGIDKEIESLNLLINQDQLLDPRMMGDVQ